VELRLIIGESVIFIFFTTITPHNEETLKLFAYPKQTLFKHDVILGPVVRLYRSKGRIALSSGVAFYPTPNPTSATFAGSPC
jgi:hypothetical protein